jgi:hypothetical protein
MRPLVDSESRNRIRKVSVCPLTVVASALNEFGRTDATTALLTALNKVLHPPAAAEQRPAIESVLASRGGAQLPKKWRLEIEKEANDDAGDIDYVLNEELEQFQEECDEHAEITIAHELLCDFEPFAEIDTDNQKVSKLSTISAALKQELTDWKKFRTSNLNRLRIGSKVVEITHDHEVQTVLRFLGYVRTVLEINQPTFKKVFCSQDVGATVERYAQWLEDKQLAWSSITNYLSALVAAAQFACVEMETPPPLDQLSNLRRQVFVDTPLEPRVAPRSVPSNLASFAVCRRRRWRGKRISTRRRAARGSTGKTQALTNSNQTPAAPV